jgi:hypothetical protein
MDYFLHWTVEFSGRISDFGRDCADVARAHTTHQHRDDTPGNCRRVTQSVGSGLSPAFLPVFRPARPVRSFRTEASRARHPAICPEGFAVRTTASSGAKESLTHSLGCLKLKLLQGPGCSSLFTSVQRTTFHV